MHYQFPPDLHDRVQARLADGSYQSEDDLFRDAMNALEEFDREKVRLFQEGNRVASEQSRLGLSKPLDLSAMLQRWKPGSQRKERDDMPSAVWAPKAESDLEEILYYVRVTAGQPLAAERIGREIFEAVQQRAMLPNSGSRHLAAPAGWRYMRHKRWLIFYQPHSQGIEVMRVVDGVRDLPRALADPAE